MKAALAALALLPMVSANLNERCTVESWTTSSQDFFDNYLNNIRVNNGTRTKSEFRCINATLENNQVVFKDLGRTSTNPDNPNNIINAPNPVNCSENDGDTLYQIRFTGSHDANEFGYSHLSMYNKDGFNDFNDFIHWDTRTFNWFWYDDTGDLQYVQFTDTWNAVFASSDYALILQYHSNFTNVESKDDVCPAGGGDDDDDDDDDSCDGISDATEYQQAGCCNC